jgi:hypothetical protein
VEHILGTNSGMIHGNEIGYARRHSPRVARCFCYASFSAASGRGALHGRLYENHVSSIVMMESRFATFSSRVVTESSRFVSST